jgi:hypothetical protein
MTTKAFFGRGFSTLAALFLIIGCQGSQNPKLGKYIGETKNRKQPPRQQSEPIPSGLTIAQLNGMPITGATVMIGTERNKPFPNNIVTSDSEGHIPVFENWTTPQPVTIEAPGFVRATYYDVSPGDRQLLLRKIPSHETVAVAGTATGFTNLEKDGFVDMALVMTTATRGQMAQFQLGSFISPELDTLDLPMGQKAQLPSNTSIPRQKETYVLSLTLDKPVYRMFLEPGFDYRLIAAHVRFPIKSTVDGIRSGQSFFEIINNFDFKEMGWRDVTAREGTTNQDMAITTVSLANTIAIKPPIVKPDQVVLAAALVPMGQQFFPSDIKKLEAGKTASLHYPSKEAPAGFVLGVLRSKDSKDTQGARAEIFSSTIVGADKTDSMEFLPILNPPTFKSNKLKIKTPQILAAGIVPRGTFAILSNVRVEKTPTRFTEVKTPQWDVYSPRWDEKIALPKFPQDLPRTTEKQRWEVMLLGDTSGSPATDIGPLSIENVSHVTKAAVDL